MTLAIHKSPEVWLAQRARDLAAGINPLFHGTRYPNLILKYGSLEPDTITGVICFSRSPEAAAYFATMERENDEGRGAIFVFDRDRLAMRYRLELVDHSAVIEELEERVCSRCVSLGAGLLGFVGQPAPRRPPQERRQAANQIGLRTFNIPGGKLTTTRAVVALGKEFEGHVLETLMRDNPLSKPKAIGSSTVHQIAGRRIFVKVRQLSMPGIPPIQLIDVALAESAC